MKCVYVYFLAAIAFVRATPTPCEKACPKIYKPVCGYDGQNYKIFDNDCLLEVGSCTDATTYSSAPMSQCLMRSEKECPKVCPYIYLPVCATDGQTTVVFSNKCLFEVQACQDSKPWVLTLMDKCNVRSATPCEKACPKIYKPVCGYDGQNYKIFDNDCLLEVGSCTDATTYSSAPMSQCLMRSEKECPKVCPHIYLPVCATDGQTSVVFVNPCVVEAQACQDSKPWVLTSMDKCNVRSATPCEKACPKIYKPVCGYDGQNYKIFDNDCLLEVGSCTDATTYSAAPMSHCLMRSERQCHQVCPLIYAPVCATDGQTSVVFSNKCIFEAQTCQDSAPWVLTSMDKCTVRSVKKSCDKVCTMIYAPVCGFDGQNFKVFASECVMEAESCLDSKPYTLVNMNNCESPMARSSCMRACNMNYDPVCGFDGERYQIFGNKCMFEGSNCEDSYKWQEMSLDTCEAHGLSAWA